jgi:hypothetical protein
MMRTAMWITQIGRVGSKAGVIMVTLMFFSVCRARAMHEPSRLKSVATKLWHKSRTLGWNEVANFGIQV